MSESLAFYGGAVVRGCLFRMSGGEGDGCGLVGGLMVGHFFDWLLGYW